MPKVKKHHRRVFDATTGRVATVKNVDARGMTVRRFAVVQRKHSRSAQVHCDLCAPLRCKKAMR